MKNVFQIFILHILFINIFTSKLKKHIKIYTKVKHIKITKNDIINKEIAYSNNNKTALNEPTNPLEQNKNDTEKEEPKIEAMKVKYVNHHHRDSDKWSTGAIVGLIVGAVVLIIGASILALVLRNRKNQSVQPVDDKTKTVVYLKTDRVINNANNANNNKV